MSDTARDYQTTETASTKGLEDLFESRSQGETWVTPDTVEDVEGITQGNTELLTLAEAARRLNIPYTTFYKQVKAGKHATEEGPDGKPRVILSKFLGVTPGVTMVTGECQGETSGVFQPSMGVTEAKHLEIIQQASPLDNSRLLT
ncbi:MAG: hypothetical protein AB1457_18270 [Chloroflexota bacterium]|jgi:hypothetical protein